METLMKADIFFFVTTISVVIISLFLVIVLYYAIRIFKKFSHFVDVVEDEAHELVGDFREVRQEVKSEVHETVQTVSRGREALYNTVANTTWQELFGAVFIAVAKMKKVNKKNNKK